jgi:hypothetical protein
VQITIEQLLLSLGWTHGRRSKFATFGGLWYPQFAKGRQCVVSPKKVLVGFYGTKNKMDIKLCKHLVSYGLGLVISRDFFVIENTNSCAS